MPAPLLSLALQLVPIMVFLLAVLRWRAGHSARAPHEPASTTMAVPPRRRSRRR